MPDARAILDAACAAGDPPAAAGAMILDGALVHTSAHGASPDGRACTPESVFDVASVTKVLATTAAIARLVSDGALALDATVTSVLPRFPHDAVTVRALLGHRSGLPAWRPFFVDALRDPIAAPAFSATPAPEAFERARAVVLDGLYAAPIERPGARVYSDLGFMLLGELVEAVSGARLDAFAARDLFGDLDLGFVDLRAPRAWLDDRHVLPTGTTRPREPAPGQEQLYTVPAQPPRADAGRVDDDNAFAMGGVAGHAGVFGTAPAVAAFGASLLDELEGARRLGIAPDVLRAFFTIDPAEGPPRALGFDVPTGPTSSAGTIVGTGPRGAFGHLGFTGCSLWLDLDRRASIALLTNRTFRGRDRVTGIRALRPAVHDALLRTHAR